MLANALQAYGCEYVARLWQHVALHSKEKADQLKAYQNAVELLSVSPPHLCHAASVNPSKKGSPYSITERRVPELITVLGSQPAGDVSHKPGCHYFPPGLQLPPQPLRGLLPVLLLGEQRHNGCEQFA